jgi:hypothetical protein
MLHCESGFQAFYAGESGLGERRSHTTTSTLRDDANPAKMGG